MIAINDLIQKLPEIARLVIVFISMIATYLVALFSFTVVSLFIALKTSQFFNKEPNINKKGFLVFGIIQNILQLIVFYGLLFAESKNAINLGNYLTRIIIFFAIFFIISMLLMLMIKKTIYKSQIDINSILFGISFIIATLLLFFSIKILSVIAIIIIIPAGLFLVKKIRK